MSPDPSNVLRRARRPPSSAPRRVSLLAALAVASAIRACTAQPPPGAAVRVALYVGAGTAPTSAGNLTAVLSAMVSRGALASLSRMQAADVAGLSRAAFDLFVVPGGTGSSEYKALGAAGAAAVRAFARAGGGYYGTCAGAFLAGTDTCCDAPMAGYCGGGTGCSPSATALGLVDMGAAEPWDRGHGYVSVSFSDATVRALRLDAGRYGGGKNVSVLYYQGPIQDRGYAGRFEANATFETEIATGHPQWTTGQMVHTPALVTTTFGAGRVLLSSPHPEETVPRLDDVVEAYALWAAGAI